MNSKEKLGFASWHQPTLGIDCPYCQEWDDYYKQWVEHEYPFDVCKNIKREELKGIEWQCPHCEKVFELEEIEY